MALTKFLARDLTIEIDTSGGYGTDWTHIGGLETLTHSPSTTRTDTTDYDSQGSPEHLVAERGDSWALAGFRLEDVATGDRDPGQAAVEALAHLLGTDAFGSFRITSPGGNMISFTASCEVTNPGGGHNDAATWAANVTINGVVEYA